jgi:hypothetical protein
VNSKLGFSLASIALDTSYYQSGEIKTISVYPNTLGDASSNLIARFELQKKVLEYDKCGNLRSIIEVRRYTGLIESCYDDYFKNPYQITHRNIRNVNCDEKSF